MKTKFKMPEVGDHILLKLTIHTLENECLLTKLEDEEYCVINLENGKGIRDEYDDLICSDSIPELLGELQQYYFIYLMEN